MFIGYCEEVYVGKKLISCKLIWENDIMETFDNDIIVDTYVEKIMNGETAVLHDKKLVDRVIKSLEGREHLGIVIAFCSPWYVRVVFPDKKLKYKDLKVGKYYKVLSKNERDCSDYLDSFESRISLNNFIVYIESNFANCTLTLIRTFDGLKIGSKSGLYTYLDKESVEFIEVEKPKDFNLEFVGKKIVYYKDFETGCYYKCLDGENEYYNQILYVGHTDYYFLTTFGEDDFILNNDMPFIKVEPKWIDV
jgi:hypothetical protein